MKTLPLYEAQLPVPLKDGKTASPTSSCTLCPRHSAAGSVCIAAELVEGTTGAGTLLVIDEAPDREADRAGRPFVSQRGSAVRKLARLWAGNVVLDYASKCMGDSEDATTEKCAPYMRATFLEADPDRVIVMGHKAVRAVLGRYIPTLDTRKAYSWVITDTGKRVPVFTVIDPDQAKSNRFLQKYLEEDFEWACTVDLSTLFQPLTDEVFHIVETAEDARIADEYLRRQEWVAYDCETAGKMWSDFFSVVSVALTPEDADTAFVWGRQALADPEALKILQDILADEGIGKTGHNCLTGDSLVTLADGSRKRLKDMVNSRDPGPVLTINEVTGALEAKRVVGWVKAPARAWGDWLRVEVRGRSLLSITADHQVLTGRGRVAAADLIIGDRIATELPNLTQVQQALLFGGMAGDGSMTLGTGRKSPAYHVSHCAAQKAYLALKVAVLGSLVTSPMRVRPNTKGFSPADGVICSADTACDRRLFKVYDTCFIAGKKQMNPAWVGQLTLAALAIWYCDDGSCSKLTAKIALGNLGGHELLLSWLRSYEFPARLYTNPAGQTYIVISGNGVKGAPSPDIRAFWEAIGPYVPVSMSYKLPARYRHLASDSYWVDSGRALGVYYDEVVTIKPLARATAAGGRTGGLARKGGGPRQYCLTVDGNANFFAGRLAVSNCKYDMLSAKAGLGTNVNGFMFDTQLARHLELPGCLVSLDVCSELVGMGAYKGEFGKILVGARNSIKKARKKSAGNKQLSLLQEDPVLVAAMAHPTEDVDAYAYGLIRSPDLERYNARDTVATRRMAVSGHGLPRVTSHAPTKNIWHGVTKHMPDAYTQVEAWGVGVDREAIRKFNDYITDKVRVSERKFSKLGLNLGSSKQMAELIFDKLKLQNPRVKDRRDPKARSTDADALKAMKNQHPLIAEILEHRRLLKLKEGYGGLADFIREDGRIHPEFRIDGTQTGRSSLANPSLHTIPREEDGDGNTEGRMIKMCFSAGPGRRIVALDQSQIEYRVAAAESQDPVMRSMFLSGDDFHMNTARLIAPLFWKIRPEDVLKAHRSEAKGFSFGLLYGMADKTIAENLGIQKERASELRATIMGKWTNLAEWIEDQIEYAQRTGTTVSTWNGKVARIRNIYQIGNLVEGGRDLSPAARKAMAARNTAKNGSFNSPIQGKASDFVQSAVGKVVPWLQHSDVDAKLILTVHDSLVLDVAEDDVERVIAHIRGIMTDYDLWGVPLVADAEEGPSWGELKKVS